MLIRLGRFAWLGLVSALACSGEVGVEDQVALAIVAPVDGAVVRRGDDVSDAAGIQVDVAVRAEGVLDGTEVVLDVSTNPLAITSARVEAGVARFAAFTVPPGELTLHAATATCTTATCFAAIRLTVVDSDTVVAIARPTEGEVVPVGDVVVSVVRESGAVPQSCRIDVDGQPIGNFFWTNQAQPLTASSSLPAGPHTVQAFCSEGLDTVPTQRVSFTVGGPAPTLTIASAPPAVLNATNDLDPTTPGLQLAIAVDAAGFADGAGVVVCSTADPGAGEPCAGGGFVVGRGEVVAGVVVVTVTLAEGVQRIHVEAERDPRVASAAIDATVDTVPPEILSVVFPTNDAVNDVPGVLRFARRELDADDALAVQVTTAGVEPGQLLIVTVDGSGAGSWGSATAVYDFAQSLADGAHDLVFAIADSAGNITRLPRAIVVDRVAGTVVVDPPAVTPFTVATIASGVTISDASGGGAIVLEVFAAPSGGQALASYGRTSIGSGETHITFASLPIPQGLSYLQATYTDALGNDAVSPRVLHAVDAIGPQVTLGVRTASGTSQACDASACLADTRDLAAARVGLDRTASDATCGFGPCSALGTDLVFTLTDCVNSDALLETCPVTVRLQSRRPGETAWADVANGVFTSGETLAASVLTDPRFDPATVRELRLVTQDSNGNPGVSNSVFLTLNFSGTRIDMLERLDVTLAPTGDAASDDRYYGIAESVVDPTSGAFQTNYRVHFTAYDVAPTTVRVTIDSIAGSNAYEVPTSGPGSADVPGVTFAVATNPAAPTTNTITVQAMCGPDPCGSRVYTGIVADIEAPTYEFSRLTLCDNGVPLVPTGCDPAAAIAGAGNPAIWNLARDADHDGANGFDARPIAVTVNGLEDGRTVRLETDLGTLTNASVQAVGGTATFPALSASHLPGSEVRRISVSFTDRAGNVAKPLPSRGDASHESIYARTDVIAPRAVVTNICIGESTGTDSASLEPSACNAACAATGACNRTEAAATLDWVAPGDDGGAGTVSTYFIGIAALGVDYGAGAYSDCAELAIGSAGYERMESVPHAPLGGGAVERLGVSGLYPHRDYCVVVAATDDVGNEGPRSVVARRKIPLVTVPTAQPFDGVVRDDAQAAYAFRSEPAAPQDYGAFATSLPDLDADGRDDFAVTQLTSGSVQVFLSGAATGAFAPAVTINAPAIAYSGSFGAAVAGGDFDGDGLHDLVICDPTLTTSGFPQAGARGGALFLYYGVAGSGIARTVNTTAPQVPSLHPDVSLLGGAGQELCANISFARGGLIATTGPTSNVPRGYIVAYGSRARLPAGPSYFDVASAPDAALVAGIPRHLAVGDFDADGDDEAVIADEEQLYVFDGASLATTLALEPGVGFGSALATVPTPGAAPGDWLLAGTRDGRVIVLAPGFTSASSPLAPGSYATLDNTTWRGVAAARFGRSLASLGNFDGATGGDIAVGPGTTTSGAHPTFIYSFDEDSGVFEKRAILEGGAGFGSTLVGVRGYAPASSAERSQLLVVQRFAARLFMFR